MDVKDSTNRTIKSIIIDKEKYQSLLKMLESSEEDAEVAFQAIDNLDKDKNLIPILLLRKHTFFNNKANLWSERCKKHVSHQETLGIEKFTRSITYNSIYDIMIQNKKSIPSDHVKLFVEDLCTYFKNNMIKFDFVEDIDIQIIIK